LKLSYLVWVVRFLEGKRKKEDACKKKRKEWKLGYHVERFSLTDIRSSNKD